MASQRPLRLPALLLRALALALAACSAAASATTAACAALNEDEPLPGVAPADLLQELPAWMKTACPRSDPNSNDCLRSNFEGAFPYMARGIPEVALPAFEPLTITRLELQRGQGAVALGGTFRGVLVRGASNATADFARFDEARQRLDFGLQVPDMRLEADYDLRGHLLVLPLAGSGRVRMHLRNTTTVSRTRVQIRCVGGREIIHATHMTIDFNVGTMSIHLDNLFGGNKVLGATLNTFLNQNAQAVIADLRQPMGDSLSELFLDMMNRVLHRMPMDLWLV